MITRVVLAKLSPTMEEGTIVKWSKKEGDAIKVGDVLAEIETDKANMEMEALGSGVLRKILVQAGGKAPIGSLIGVIADPNEDISAMLAEAAKAAPAASLSQHRQLRHPRRHRGLPPRQRRPGTDAGCRARRRAGPAAAPGGRVKSSPLARAIAAQKNVPLTLSRAADPAAGSSSATSRATSPHHAAAGRRTARPAAPVPAVAGGHRDPSRTSAA
jgi:pyruvate dehydrogenase E2 component (dihydrolipoamide acetyltransferase)